MSMNEPQFRIAPEALERDDLLEGVEGPVQDRLSAVLHSAATSYRAVLDEPSGRLPPRPHPAPPPNGPTALRRAG